MGLVKTHRGFEQLVSSETNPTRTVDRFKTEGVRYINMVL